MYELPARGTQARADLDARIVAAIDQVMTAAITICLPPAGHRWRWNLEQATRWFGRDVVSSVHYGASAILERQAPDDDDLEQFRAELRVFADAMLGRVCKPEAAFRAILWVQQGPNFFGRSRDILAPVPRFLDAPDARSLGLSAGSTIAASIAIEQARISPASSESIVP